jgi:hypothetical protein
VAAYTPTVFVRAGRKKTAYTWADHYAYLWNGWDVLGVAPSIPRDDQPASLADIDGVNADSNHAFARFKQLARTPEALIVGAITRDANGAATAAPVEWPDGADGVYVATALSEDFPGAVDAYYITKVGSHAATFTQGAVTRDENGAVIYVPEIVVT